MLSPLALSDAGKNGFAFKKTSKLPLVAMSAYSSQFKHLFYVDIKLSQGD